MVINLVFVAGTMVLSLIGTSPAPGLGAGEIAGPAAAIPAVPAVKVAARVDSFSPPPKAAKKRKAPPARSPGSVQPESVEEDVDEDQPPARRPPPTTRRRLPVEEMESEAGEEEEEEDDDEKPKPKKKRKRVVEEEEEEDEEDDAPMASLPVILPRPISVMAGVSAIGRSFAFNTMTQQKESTFPRPGIALTIEAFPLLRMPRGWHKRLGVGLTLAMEFGAAALANMTTGASTSFPVTQRRWSLDVRYAIPLGERFVLVPALGYGTNAFDLKTLMPATQVPTVCDSSSTMPCLADIYATYAVAGGHIRIAATESLAFSLSGGYFLGLSVSRGPGQLAVESTETKVSGFHIEPGVTFMLKDWLALRAAIPIVRYDYAFTNQMAVYKSATETYYGINGGAVIFMQ